MRLSKGFYPACSRSLNPAQPRLAGQPEPWLVQPIPSPQTCSRARVAQQLDSASWQPWWWWLFPAAIASVTTRPEPAAQTPPPLHHTFTARNTRWTSPGHTQAEHAQPGRRDEAACTWGVASRSETGGWGQGWDHGARAWCRARFAA